MSTATEISRLITARNKIRDKMIELGLGVNTDKLDVLANEVDSITNRGSVSATVQEGDTYTIPAGYHNGSGTVSGVAGGGNYSLQSKSVTPTKNQQSVTPDNGYYGLSDVTVQAIPEAYQNVTSVTASADDVLANKIIVDSAGIVTTGTMANNGAVSKVLDATNGNQSYAVPTGYHNGSGTVSIVLETKNATPSTAAQNIIPTNGKVLSKVTVGAIPSAYQDVTSVNAVAADVLSGKTIVSSNGTKITGTMPNRGATNYVYSSSWDFNLGDTHDYYSVNIDSGYHNGNGEVEVYISTKTATPSTAMQVIFPDDGTLLTDVTVNPIPSAYQDVTSVTASAADVLSGKVIVSSSGSVINGSMADRGTVTQTLDATAGKQSYTIPAGKHSGSGTVSITLETKTATPTESAQTITPTSGKVISSVSIDAIPSNYVGSNIAQNSSGDLIISGATVTAPSGYYAAVASKTIPSGSATTPATSITANPAISISASGLITATASATKSITPTVSAGYITAGTAGTATVSGSSTSQLDTQAAATITPSTARQTVGGAGKFMTGAITVSSIPSIYGDTSTDTAVASYLLSGYKAHTKSGTSAVQITGTMANNGAVSGSIDGLTVLSYAIPSGYTSGGTVSLTNDIETALAAI